MIFNSINNDYGSYDKIIKFYHQHKNDFLTNINLSIYGWFGANMASPLGAILELFSDNINTIVFDELSYSIETILKKNRFLSYYGREQIADVNHTTISFQKLSPKDGKYFKKYVYEELLNREELPIMSEHVRDKIAEGIYEIFVNAQIHSETENIFTCGQFFPNKNKIEFTITDIGIGFRERIKRRFCTEISSGKAIQWAVRDRNTTKLDKSGGIGLDYLKTFIDNNNGKLQIISYDGFYQFSGGEEIIENFELSFPGTVVNVEFRTDDNKLYEDDHIIDLNTIFD